MRHHTQWLNLDMDIIICAFPTTLSACYIKLHLVVTHHRRELTSVCCEPVEVMDGSSCNKELTFNTRGNFTHSLRMIQYWFICIVVETQLRYLDFSYIYNITALRRRSLDITSEASALVEVMAWCRHHAIKDTHSDLTILFKISPSQIRISTASCGNIIYLNNCMVK